MFENQHISMSFKGILPLRNVSHMENDITSALMPRLPADFYD